jgi:hypothetical protein
MIRIAMLSFATVLSLRLCAQTDKQDSLTIAKFFETALTDKKGYDALRSLCKDVGHRLSGSPQCEKAVQWSVEYLKSCGADTVYLQDVMVPHWVRGEKESASIKSTKNKLPVSVNVLALGGSIGTPDRGLQAGVVEVNGMAGLEKLKYSDVEGKILFFNGPMEDEHINTFRAYGRCVGQRWAGAMEAAKLGAVGVVVRSVTLSVDYHPHTGSMGYADTIKKIPAVAIAAKDAEALSNALKQDPQTQFWFRTTCQILPDVPSHNVIAELRGNILPDEYLVIGGHLDSWDVGDGAHDDGAGMIHSGEVIRLMKQTGYTPKRTVRVVFFMNEENGLRGAIKYAEWVKETKQKHVLALESDAGGFTPRGFAFDTDSNSMRTIRQWQPLLREFYSGDILLGWSGADVGKLKGSCDVLAGFLPDSQRYFDHHHAETDVFESVHPRELELGAAACTALIYLFDKHWEQRPR